MKTTTLAAESVGDGMGFALIIRQLQEYEALYSTRLARVAAGAEPRTSRQRA